MHRFLKRIISVIIFCFFSCVAIKNTEIVNKIIIEVLDKKMPKAFHKIAIGVNDLLKDESKIDKKNKEAQYIVLLF